MIESQSHQEVGFGIALRAAIFHKGKILLLLRSRSSKGEYGFWELPGGRMNLGERYEDAVKREVFEETGLKIRVIRPLNVFDARRDVDTQVVGITFMCALEGEEISVRLSDEHLESEWVSLDRIGSKKVIPGLHKEAALWKITE